MLTKDHLTEISNVLVIGSGGAGLRAAIEVKQAGLAVTVLGKRAKTDVHTVLAAGGINAAFGNLDTEDSWQHHFVDTYLEGYGIGEPRIIELMVQEAPELVNEIDKWGANFAKLKNGKLDQRFFGAHTFRRTCYAGDYTGQSILNTLLERAEKLKIPIYDSQYVTELLVNDQVCFGAMSFNIRSGERTIHLADAVILCAGGHTRIWRKSSSRIYENNGDGYYLGLKSGCQLRDMEMVQFHPTGMVLPEDLAGTLVTEAVRGEGGKLFNVNGERFMANYDEQRMELSTRDIVAMANYTEIVEGRATPNGGVFLDISHKDKNFILEKIPRIYKQFLESQGIDISKEPMEVAPTAHYSMGGLVVTPEEHWTGIQGLYAAGEVTGGLHGANRLGGNSLAEILVFGKRAGRAACDYSKNSTKQLRSENIIQLAHEKINSLIKKGNHSAKPIQNHLSNIMWKSCGVLKEENGLYNGLVKIKELQKILQEIDVQLEYNSCNDLVVIFDLEASLLTSEATIMSAIHRKESRGAHQRSDYKETKKINNVNYRNVLKNNNIEVLCYQNNPVSRDLAELLIDTKRVDDFNGKLIE